MYDSRSNVLLSKESGTGIDQTDNGTYTITVPADELNDVTFPAENYRYAVRITEGDTGNMYLLQHGPFRLKDLPF